MFTKNKYLLVLIGILSLVIILLTPYGFHIDLGPGPNSLMAILWEYWDLDVFRWFTVLEYVPYYLFRFVALFYIMRYLVDATTKKRAIIITIISEIIPLLISIPGILILDPSGHNYIPIMIAIPILLLNNLSLIFIYSKRKLKNTNALKSDPF